MSTNVHAPTQIPSPAGPADPAVDAPPVRRTRRRRILGGFAVLAAVLGLVLASTGCSPADQSKDAIRQHFRGQVAYATKIAKCESGLNPRVMSPGGGNVGLFQINHVHWNWVRARYGYTVEDLKNPYKNARVARAIFDQAGGSWRPWSCSRLV